MSLCSQPPRRAASSEGRAQSSEQRTENSEQRGRAENREQRSESGEQRNESREHSSDREQRAESGRHRDRELIINCNKNSVTEMARAPSYPLAPLPRFHTGKGGGGRVARGGGDSPVVPSGRVAGRRGDMCKTFSAVAVTSGMRKRQRVRGVARRPFLSIKARGVGGGLSVERLRLADASRGLVWAISLRAEIVIAGVGRRSLREASSGGSVEPARQVDDA